MRDQPTTVINATGFPISAAELERVGADLDRARAVMDAMPRPSPEHLAELERRYDAVQAIAKASPLYHHLTRVRAL